MEKNIDQKVVDEFGAEWTKFDQTEVSEEELRSGFEAYFSVFPWHELADNPVGFDLGCGSGRWANFCADRVGTLHCIDPSSAALEVATKKLSAKKNCVMHNADAESIPLPDDSMDFGYSLGVLHHVPDTASALRACIKKLKPGAPFLVYLYYALDNKPTWFRALWSVSDRIRKIISQLPESPKFIVCHLIALLVYWPLARLANVAEKAGLNPRNFPLCGYRNNSLYTMRTDALDRFGTRLEHRFTREQIREMMQAAGLERVKFRDGIPYWCAVGYRSE